MMATVSVTSSRVISMPRQAVYVGGVRRPDIEIYSLSESHGLRPQVARFIMPAEFVETADLDFLSNQLITVYASDGNSTSFGTPRFRGFAVPRERMETSAMSQVTFYAMSLIGWLDEFRVGTNYKLPSTNTVQMRGQLTFLQRDPVTQEESGWTLSNILEYVFSSKVAPSALLQLIELGDLRGLERTGADPTLPDLRFPAQSYYQLIKELLGKVPDVGVREIHGATKTRLDFYKVQDARVTPRVIVAPNASNGTAQGAYVTAAVYDTTTDGIKARAIGYGAGYETMVTAGSSYALAAGRLEPMWTTEAYPLPEEGDPTTNDAEDAVLSDPEVGTPGSPRYNELYRDTLRLWRLPGIMRRHLVLNKNAFRDLNGKQLDVQVFRRKRNLVSDEESGYDAEVVADTYELIEGFELDEDGFLRLPRPAVYNSRVEVDEDNNAVYSYALDDIFVTVTLQEPDGRRLVYDSGTRGTLVLNGTLPTEFSFINNNVRYQRIASDEDEFEDLERTYSFGCIYFDPDSNAWESVDAGSSVVLRDDSRFLGELTERALAEQMRQRTSARVQLEVVRQSYRIGDQVQVLNRGIDGTRMTIMGVTWSFSENRTIIWASDQVPQVVELDRVPPPAHRAGDINSMAGANATRPGFWHGATTMDAADMQPVATPDWYRNMIDPVNPNNNPFTRPSGDRGFVEQQEDMHQPRTPELGPLGEYQYPELDFDPSEYLR